MEIHHPHHHDLPGKKEKLWKHYIIEFFMLFLAISAGFFVENQRENYSEQVKAKQYAQLLISDLASDTLNIQAQAARNILKEEKLDTLMQLLAQPIQPAQSNDVYYYSRVLSEFISFVSNDATFQELKSSGSLRYFKNPYLVSQITNYYSNAAWMNLGYSGDASANTMKLEAMKITSQILKEKYFYETIMQDKYDFMKDEKRLESQTTLLSTDPTLLNQLAALAGFEKEGSQKGRIFTIDVMQKEAADLIDSLKKEYH